MLPKISGGKKSTGIGTAAYGSKKSAVKRKLKKKAKR